MNLMTNSYFKFPNIQMDSFILKDTTLLSQLPKIPLKFLQGEYIVKKHLEDDILIEKISFDIYGTTDYWDILFVLNDMTNLNELPKRFDTLAMSTEREVDKLIEKYKTTNIKVTTELKEELYGKILKEKLELNEKYRTFKYLMPSDMSELINDLNFQDKYYSYNLI